MTEKLGGMSLNAGETLRLQCLMMAQEFANTRQASWNEETIVKVATAFVGFIKSETKT